MSYDVIVVGGGIAGAALTYALAQAGAQTLLLDQGAVAGGASGATMGMALWVSTRSERDMAWAAQGFDLLPALEQELDAGLDYRLLPSLVLAPDSATLAGLAHQAQRLRAAGLPASIVSAEEIAEIEPALDHRPFVGALYGEQGHLDGAALTRAYVDAAWRAGAEIREHLPAIGFDVADGRVAGVRTIRGMIPAGHVVLAAGAWTRRLGALAGVDLPLYYIHGEALATSPRPPILRSMLMVARPDGHSALERRVAAAMEAGARWEQWQDTSEARDLSAVQLDDGRVLLGQVSRAIPTMRTGVRPAAVEEIRREAARLVPALGDAPVERRWVAPVPFTPGQQALVGLLLGHDNLYVCAGFKSALITAPVACRDLAQQLVARREQSTP